MNTKKLKKVLLPNLPFILVGLFATNLGEAWRLSNGGNVSEKIQSLFIDGMLTKALSNPMPSLFPFDLLIGILVGGGLWLFMYLKKKNAKNYRHNQEYGSARWGTQADIEPYMDPVFENNVILSMTERITMNSRPKNPKYARNKNVLVVGGSGSGKTRFFIKPNILQRNGSYVITDPKGSLIGETAKALIDGGYRIKVFNTINFKKSMHYNPFMYIHDEKDILTVIRQ